MAGRSKRRKKHRAIRFFRSFLLTLILALAVGVAAVAGYKFLKDEKGKETLAEEEDTSSQLVTVDGIDISQYDRNSLLEHLLERNPWSMSVIGDYDSIELQDVYEQQAQRMVDMAFDSDSSGAFSTAFDEDSAEEEAAFLAAIAQQELTVSVPESVSMRYVSANDAFEYSDPVADRIVDADDLKEQIKTALMDGDYTAKIEAKTTGGDIPYRAGDFKQIGYYQTHTTNNSDRNTNVRLSCEAVNGTVLLPGEQFSYNEKLGRRTAEKGYKEAGAYSNGEHVMELGGGVCQLSSSLYNAVISANLEVNERTGHTYEPSYVTPGEDATVSYSKPDFVFTNNTEAPVGILTHYADRTVTVQIFGLPQLPEGVTQHLRSEKIADIDPPMPNYIEDPLVVPGYEDIVKHAKNGSKWKTWIVQEKDGEVISEEYLHTTSYKGEPATIRRNLAGLAALGLVPQPDAAVAEEGAHEAP